MAGLGELVEVIGCKLEAAVCANEQEEAEKREGKPGMLSHLIRQLHEVHTVHGDLRVFAGGSDMEPVQTVSLPSDHSATAARGSSGTWAM